MWHSWNQRTRYPPLNVPCRYIAGYQSCAWRIRCERQAHTAWCMHNDRHNQQSSNHMFHKRHSSLLFPNGPLSDGVTWARLLVRTSRLSSTPFFTGSRSTGVYKSRCVTSNSESLTVSWLFRRLNWIFLLHSSISLTVTAIEFKPVHYFGSTMRYWLFHSGEPNSLRVSIHPIWVNSGCVSCKG